MAANQTIDFKDPLWITKWLDTALKKEKEKYERCPVIPDLVSLEFDTSSYIFVYLR